MPMAPPFHTTLAALFPKRHKICFCTGVNKTNAHEICSLLFDNGLFAHYADRLRDRRRDFQGRDMDRFAVGSYCSGADHLFAVERPGEIKFPPGIIVRFSVRENQYHSNPGTLCRIPEHRKNPFPRRSFLNKNPIQP